MDMTALNNGTKIPRIGFGLWRNRDRDECVNAVHQALEVGYRHFDTAQIYGNEKYLGEALKASRLKREELFVTTKIWNDNQFWDDLIPSFDQSLKDLQTDYVDLLLVHFPVSETRRAAWHKMEELASSGRAKAIGVSNYTVEHLEELIRENSVVPAVNQVELHVYLQQPELVEYCRQNSIVVEAYSPLAHSYGLDNKDLARIAEKYSKTTAQIMLRWCVEAGTVPLPKSIHPDRIQENFDIFDFELDEDDKSRIAKLDKDFRTCWDPTHVA